MSKEVPFYKNDFVLPNQEWPDPAKDLFLLAKHEIESHPEKYDNVKIITTFESFSKDPKRINVAFLEDMIRYLYLKNK